MAGEGWCNNVLTFAKGHLRVGVLQLLALIAGLCNLPTTSTSLFLKACRPHAPKLPAEVAPTTRSSGRENPTLCSQAGSHVLPAIVFARI